MSAFNIEPLYDNGKFCGLSVNVVPKQNVKFIEVTLSIEKQFDNSKLN